MAGRVRKKIGVLLSLLLLSAFIIEAAAAAPGTETDSGAQDAQKQVETVDPIRDDGSYSAVVYNNRNGMPTSEANDIAETGDGFLWIASYSGLIRYDGIRFERIEGISNIGCLYVDSKDRLWIGTNDGGLGMMERGQLSRWRETDGLISSKISDITEDSSGTIYVGTTQGILTIDTEMQFGILEDQRIQGLYIDMLYTGSDGLIYGICSNGDCFTLRDGKVAGYMRSEESSVGELTRIFADPANPGMVYAGTGDSRLFYGSFDGSLKVSKTLDVSPLVDIRDIEQFGDRIWICARNGIGMLSEGQFYCLSGLPMDNSIKHVMMDYEGNLWFTSTRQGVMKIVHNSFLDVFEKYGLPETVANSTCMSDGMLLIGTEEGLIALDQDGIVPAIPLTEVKTASGEELGENDLLEMLRECRIRSVIRDSRKRIWISTWKSRGLLCYDKGKVTVYSRSDGLLSDQVRAVYERKDGSILVVNTGGVSVIEDGRVTVSYGEAEGITNIESLTVTEAPNGDILLGSNGAGIYVINEEGIRSIGIRDGMPSGIVMRIKPDPVRNIFWLVTGNSLAYMTADYQVTTLDQFPYSDNFDLFENSHGDMWVISSDGIYVLPAEKLLANTDIKPVHYGLANGLPSTATSNSYCELTEEGDLYLAGRRAVAKVNIEKPAEEITDLKITVPYIMVDGRMFYPDENGAFSIPAHIHKVTVYSYVFNYALTDPSVSYYMEGFDKEKEVVIRSDLGPVEYTNLPGGSYQFVIQVIDSQGNVGRQVSIPIRKEKALYEQTWFYLLLFLVTALLLNAAIRHYIRKKTIALEIRNREEVRKERLNTELKMASRIQ
ncbi:MAG: two-component regulator propeller domain-containing protein, partial [Eubacteriales bacterium]|nr:two-component regulator propeller domain-containing protein [Eubacteriales bacterium]